MYYFKINLYIRRRRCTCSAGIVYLMHLKQNKRQLDTSSSSILFVLVTLVPYVLYKRENINAKYYKGENYKLMVCGKHS